jgi:phosphatidylethanolamine-binding protein (PEBP) family uncharacterized protein
MGSLKTRCGATAILGLGLVALAACSSSPKPAASSPSAAPATHAVAAITLTSTAFQEDGTIPRAYTCNSANGAVSPPLAWSAVPPGTGWIALYVYDDTGSVLHWVVLNIKPDVTSMAAGSNAGGFEVQSYLPMCPGAGNTDQYQWTLYAEPSSWHPPKVGRSYNVDPGQLAAHALGVGNLNATYSQ